MALFVGAANGRIHAPDIGASGFPLCENLCDLCDGALGDKGDMDDASTASSAPAPLSRAISVLWHHYNGDERQRAIWSRVVAFHAMMVGSKGAVVDHWTEPCVDPAEALLSPAVVNAVATAPLGEFGQFDTFDFVRVVKQFDAQFAPAFAARGAEHSLPSSSVSVLEVSIRTSGVSQNDSVEPLVTAGAADLAASPVSHEIRRFSAFEKLNQPLGALTGSAGFRAMFSRAVAINRAEFPWLSSLQLMEDGRVLDLADGTGNASPESLARAEVAVVTSLFEMLRQFVGDGITLQLLQTVPEVVPPNYMKQEGYLHRHTD